jgi:hypothetical protein
MEIAREETAVGTFMWNRRYAASAPGERCAFADRSRRKSTWTDEPSPGFAFGHTASSKGSSPSSSV